MAERKPAKTTKKTAGSGFSAEERAAMKERAKELKAEGRREDGEKALQAKLAELPKADRELGKKLHEIVTAAAPGLAPKTWYGMPAYANEDGKVVCYFTPASKFKERYSTFGFNAAANLDAGDMWPTSFALQRLGPAEEKKIAALVKKAMRGA